MDKKTKEVAETSIVSDTKTKSFIHPRHFSKFDLVFFAAIFALIGGFIIWKSFAAAPYDLPTRSINLPALGIAYWLNHDSPTTQIVGDASGGDKHRIIKWDSGGLYQNRKMYSLHGFRLVDGYPGRIYDWHTQPNAVGGWTPPCDESGVAPLSIDYFGDIPGGLQITSQAEDGGCDGGSGNYHFTIMSPSEMESKRGQWVWIWTEVTWGRRDTATKGSIKAWVAGENNPRVNVSGINTHFKNQNQVTFWEGAYQCSTCGERFQSHKIEVAATRFGWTPQMAYEDKPVLYLAGPQGGTTGTSSVINSRQSTEAAIPLSLQWGGAPAPSPAPPPPAPTPTPSPTPAPTPSPTPTPQAAAPAVTVSSNIKNGDTVANGYSWTATFSSTPSSVELWANGTKLTTDSEAPFSTAINLPLGSNKLGLCYTVNSVRTCAGTGGIYATITVVAAAAALPPSSPPPVSVTTNISDKTTVANGTIWTATLNVVPSSVEFWANGSKVSTSTTAPYSTLINLPAVDNRLGLCYTVNSARTCSGTGGVIATANVTGEPIPQDKVAPTSPTGLNVTSADKTNVSLAWKASTDNVGVSGYKLFRSDSMQPIYSGKVLQITNSSLSRGSKYTYYVKAFDKAGNNSAPSQKVCVGKWGFWSNFTRHRNWEYC